MKIEIDEMRDIIIIEKSDGDNILEGSRLFCGCCGNELGIVTQRLIFPFESTTLHKAMENISYDVSILGIRHKTCRHTMFSFKKGYDFISLDNYIKQFGKQSV